LSPVQLSMYLDLQSKLSVNPTGVYYQIPMTFVLPADVDADRLYLSWREALRRQSLLRCVIGRYVRSPAVQARVIVGRRICA
jgi:hypothetical protein